MRNRPRGARIVDMKISDTEVRGVIPTHKVAAIVRKEIMAQRWILQYSHMSHKPPPMNAIPVTGNQGDLAQPRGPGGGSQ